MTNTKDTGKLIDSHEKEKTQFYRGYLIEVSLLGCQVPRILAFCHTVASAKSLINMHINTLDARR